MPDKKKDNFFNPFWWIWMTFFILRIFENGIHRNMENRHVRLWWCSNLTPKESRLKNILIGLFSVYSKLLISDILSDSMNRKFYAWMGISLAASAVGLFLLFS